MIELLPYAPSALLLLILGFALKESRRAHQRLTEHQLYVEREFISAKRLSDIMDPIDKRLVRIEDKLNGRRA